MPKSKPDAFLYPPAWKELKRLSGAEYRLIVSAINITAQGCCLRSGEE
jgi:hypothetical protein